MRRGAHAQPVHKVSSHCLPWSHLRERRNLHSLLDLSVGGRGNCKDKVPTAASSPASFAQEPRESLRSPQIRPCSHPTTTPHTPPLPLPRPPPLIRDLTVPTSTKRLERKMEICGVCVGGLISLKVSVARHISHLCAKKTFNELKPFNSAGSLPSSRV